MREKMIKNVNLLKAFLLTIFHYWFFNHGLKFQDSVHNGCHAFIMLIVNIRDIAIMTIKNVYYRCIIHNISKSDAINWLENFVLGNPEMLKFILDHLQSKKIKIY